MPVCRYLAFILLFGFVCAPASWAQSDEPEIALPYQLIPGRLAVTFADTVSVETALSLLETLGYEVVQYDFPPVTVIGLNGEVLADEALDALTDHPLVEKVQQIDVLAMRKRGLENLRTSDPDAYEKAVANFENAEQQGQARLIFSLAATLTGEQAARLVTSLVPDVVLQKTEKRPNEAIIAVEEKDQEAAIEKIDALPEVRYVAYINAN